MLVQTSISELLFETLPDLALVVTRQGIICRVSPSCFDILGYNPDEMTGRSAKEFLYPADLDATRMEMRASRRGQVTRRFECRYVHKDGSVVALQWTGIWSEEINQHLFVGRDVTEVRTMLKLTNIAEQLQSIDAYLTSNQFRPVINWHLFTVLDVILIVASLWASYMLLVPPSNFAAFPEAFKLAMRITTNEAAWGIFAAIAATFKLAALAVRAFGDGRTATITRSVGRSMSGIFWTLIGTSYLVANPDYSMFGPIGIMLGMFALWADISQGLGQSFTDWVKRALRVVHDETTD